MRIVDIQLSFPSILVALIILAAFGKGVEKTIIALIFPVCPTISSAYIGFDPTNDSLHIGSLVQLMLLNWLETYGHKPIALMGGGTTLVGDPSLYVF